MAEPETTREEELSRLLTDAIEVQLAALKAGIGFWSDWIEETTEFVDRATKTLTSINSDDPKTRDVLLELVDAGRASARRMTELPRSTATRFLEELDRFDEKKQEAGSSKKSAAKKAGSGGPASKSKRSRSAAKTGRSPRTTAKKTRATKAAKKSSRSARRRRAGRVKE